MQNIENTLEAVDAGLDQSISRLFELLRIPSISTAPEYKDDCHKAATWLVRELTSLGFEAEVRPTKGLPMVVAHYTSKGLTKSAPHALFYGHYDVQPVDPVDQWRTPPFEPQRMTGKDGVERLVGRGTADDKGQLMTFLEAARAWIATTGSLPMHATFLLEGEEESGSPSLVPFLKANKDELSMDVAFVCDSNMWDEKTPAITTRLRGLVHEEVTITGPSIDLHSGMYGGPAINPLKVMATFIAAMHDTSGRVTIPGFYKGVKDLPPATKRQWKGLKFSESKFLGKVGLKASVGEKGKSVLEQKWARPTAEVNGMWGGYTGAGTKTVIPSQAHAKFSFRLVGQQDPKQVLKAFYKWARAQMPKGAKIAFGQRGEGSPATEISDKSEFIRKSAEALKAEWHRDAVLMGSGGSIPIVRYFKDILGMDSVLVGFGLNDDAIHSPNEKYNLSSFHRGIRSWVRIMGALSE